MRPPFRDSLKGSLLAAMVVLALAGALGASSLVWITTALDRAAEGIFRALDAARVCEELRLRILLHERAQDPVMRTHLEDRLRTLARELESYASSDAERAEVRALEQVLGSYLGRSDAAAADAELAAAFGAIDRLADHTAARARALREQAGRLNTWGDRLGAGTAVVLAVGVPLVLLWLRTAILRPILVLRASIERYAGGDRSARVRLPRPRELREISERFDEMADALARKRQEEMAFLGAVAHDIRNPLSVLSTSLATLAQRPLDAETERSFAILARQVERIAALVNDLLDAAQLEATRLPFRMETCDLARSAQEVADLFALRAEERIELRLPEAPVLVRGDPTRLHQAIANLVGNALKYAPKDSPVRIAVRSRPGGAEVSVADDGPGIPAADQALLFEPFRRAPGADRAGSGAGLGLFIAERIVHAHGGRIELHSRPGEGTLFRLLFPPADAAPDAVPALRHEPA